MNDLAQATPPRTGVFLFEDHKIARASFVLPDNCRKVSTRAWLRFLEWTALFSTEISAGLIIRPELPHRPTAASPP